MLGVGIGAAVIGLGMYLNRFVCAWRYRDDPGIMRFAIPMSKIGLWILVAGVLTLAIGVLVVST